MDLEELEKYNETQKYDPNGNRAYNQFTRSKYDVCEYENQLRLGSKPMKYYVNQFNSPQVNPFTEFTQIGNQKQYSISNDFERPLPTRLNPIYPSYVLPYSTTPFLGQAAPSRLYADTESNLRYGGSSNIREKKSAVDISSIDYNRWEPGVSAYVVQNAGAFGGSFQANAQGIGRDGYYDYSAQNNVLFANSAFPYFGISSRNEMHNYMEINNC